MLDMLSLGNVLPADSKGRVSPWNERQVLEETRPGAYPVAWRGAVALLPGPGRLVENGVKEVRWTFTSIWWPWP
jgi:hypothetical protein